MDGVAIEVRGDVDRLIPKTHDATDAPAKGQRPPASRRGVVSVGRITIGFVVPVRRDDWPAVDVPAFFQVVGDEVLQCHLVHRGAVSRPGSGKDIIDQNSERPVSRLNEGYHRWAEAQLSLAENCTGRGWEDHRGSDTPDQFSGLRGR